MNIDNKVLDDKDFTSNQLNYTSNLNTLINSFVKEIYINDFSIKKQHYFLECAWAQNKLNLQAHFNGDQNMFISTIQNGIYTLSKSLDKNITSINLDANDDVLYKDSIDIDKFTKDTYTILSKSQLKFIEDKITFYSNENRINESYDICEKLLMFDPNNVIALETISCIKLDSHNFKDSLEYSFKLLQLNNRSYIGLYNRSLARFYEGRYDIALSNVLAALNIYPNDAKLLSLCGDCYLAIEDFDKSQSYYLSSLKLDENSFSANFGLGFIFFHKNQYNLSLMYYDNAHHIDPKDCETLNTIAHIYYSISHYDKAIEYLDMAIDIRPKPSYINNKEHIIRKIKNLV